MGKHWQDVGRSKGPGVFALVEDRIKVDGVHLPAWIVEREEKQDGGGLASRPMCLERMGRRRKARNGRRCDLPRVGGS